jgi:hypothetical protein
MFTKISNQKKWACIGLYRKTILVKHIPNEMLSSTKSVLMEALKQFQQMFPNIIQDVDSVLYDILVSFYRFLLRLHLSLRFGIRRRWRRKSQTTRRT